MLLYMGTVSFDVVPIIQRRPPPGSVYKSPQVYAKLRPEMDADNSTADAVSSLFPAPTLSYIEILVLSESLAISSE
jgi:hypothetical protein